MLWNIRISPRIQGSSGNPHCQSHRSEPWTCANGPTNFYLRFEVRMQRTSRVEVVTLNLCWTKSAKSTLRANPRNIVAKWTVISAGRCQFEVLLFQEGFWLCESALKFVTTSLLTKPTCKLVKTVRTTFSWSEGCFEGRGSGIWAHNPGHSWIQMLHSMQRYWGTFQQVWTVWTHSKVSKKLFWLRKVLESVCTSLFLVVLGWKHSLKLFPFEKLTIKSNPPNWHLPAGILVRCSRIGS